MDNYTKYKVKTTDEGRSTIDRSSVFRGQMDHPTFLRGNTRSQQQASHNSSLSSRTSRRDVSEAHKVGSGDDWESTFSQATTLRPEDSASNVSGQPSAVQDDRWNLLSDRRSTVVRAKQDPDDRPYYVEDRCPADYPPFRGNLKGPSGYNRSTIGRPVDPEPTSIIQGSRRVPASNLSDRSSATMQMPPGISVRLRSTGSAASTSRDSGRGYNDEDRQPSAYNSRSRSYVSERSGLHSSRR